MVDRCRALHFDGHPCGHSVLGTIQSIDALTAEQMREYFNRRYAPNNMVVAFTGKLEWEQVSRIVEQNCAERSSEDVGRKLEDCPGSKKQERIEKPNLVREHICLISPAPSAQSEERFAASVFATIVGDDVGSRFFWRLVDKALAETATMQFAGMDGTGMLCSYIRCSNENKQEVLEEVRQIFGELSNKGVAEEELRAAKNKLLSAFVLKNELPMGRLVDLGFNWVYLGQYRPTAEDIEAIKAVTVADINALVEQFNPGDFTLLSMGPGGTS